MSRVRRKQIGGFTIIELVIVIIIVGLLALIILPGIFTAPEKTRDSQRKSDLRSIKNALETYFNDHNDYPSTSSTAIVPKTDPTLSKALLGGYMKTVPDDPKAPTRHYYYVCTTVTSGACTSYKLYASLENAKDTQINDRTDTLNGYELTSLN